MLNTVSEEKIIYYLILIYEFEKVLCFLFYINYQKINKIFDNSLQFRNALENIDKYPSISNNKFFFLSSF